MFPAFGAQLNDALSKQNARTSAALKAEKAARYEAAARRVQASASSTTVKREHDQVGALQPAHLLVEVDQARGGARERPIALVGLARHLDGGGER